MSFNDSDNPKNNPEKPGKVTPIDAIHDPEYPSAEYIYETNPALPLTSCTDDEFTGTMLFAAPHEKLPLPYKPVAP
jgi:hypothetical protein